MVKIAKTFLGKYPNNFHIILMSGAQDLKEAQLDGAILEAPQKLVRGLLQLRLEEKTIKSLTWVTLTEDRYCGVTPSVNRYMMENQKLKTNGIAVLDVRG